MHKDPPTQYNEAIKKRSEMHSRLERLPTHELETIALRLNIRKHLPDANHVPSSLLSMKIVAFCWEYDHIWKELEKAVDQIEAELFGNNTEGNSEFIIPKKKVGDLIGKFTDPDSESLGKKLVPFAFAEIKKDLFADVSKTTDKPLIPALIWNLHGTFNDTHDCPELLRFAVLCSDHAKQLGENKFASRLDEWIHDALSNKEHSQDSIRASLPEQEYGFLPVPVIEIAWNKLTSSMEAFVSWGKNMHQNIDDIDQQLLTSAHQAVTKLLENFSEKKNIAQIPINHVEIFVDKIELHVGWEYKSTEAAYAKDTVLQPFPVCVRLANRKEEDTEKCAIPPSIQERHIACLDTLDVPSFLEKVQDTGIFISSMANHTNDIPCEEIQVACDVANIGLWSRKSMADSMHLRLKNVLIDKKLTEIPKLLQKRRRTPKLNPDWRDVVLLFELDSRSFKHSANTHNAKHQARVTASL